MPNVRQLDNDVQSIYDLLNGITTTQQRHTNRLGELSDQILALDAKVTAHDARFDTLEAKLDTVLELLRDR
jgi:uncharacterized damage-inducible protein DinB